MIVGTAGHIDHGKSAVVTALTGKPMDRLAEERRRGITIDLNFAPLDLGPGLTAGVVDVPGHEDFVRTMVAGASGIDLALLVVAAAPADGTAATVGPALNRAANEVARDVAGWVGNAG